MFGSLICNKQWRNTHSVCHSPLALLSVRKPATNFVCISQIIDWFFFIFTTFACSLRQPCVHQRTWTNELTSFFGGFRGGRGDFLSCEGCWVVSVMNLTQTPKLDNFHVPQSTRELLCKHCKDLKKKSTFSVQCNQQTQFRLNPALGANFSNSTVPRDLKTKKRAGYKQINDEAKKKKHIVDFLKVAFNRSLQLGQFIQHWKCVVLRPLIKGKNIPNVKANYRPVSNLPFLSKVLEKIVLQQVNSHCQVNNLFPAHQSAYRPGHSCETSFVWHLLVHGKRGGSCHITAWPFSCIWYSWPWNTAWYTGTIFWYYGTMPGIVWLIPSTQVLQSGHRQHIL